MSWYDESVLPNECSLLGTRFPLYGMVKRKSLTPFAPKTTSGDYSREDRIIEAEWVVSTLAGGMGIRYARPNQDDDRADYGDLSNLYRFITLGPEIVKAGTLAGPIDLLAEYNEKLFAVKGEAVYRWDKPDWTVVADTNGVPHDACVHDGCLYILTSTGLTEYDGTTWTNHTGITGYALVSWDDKLWRLGSDNSLTWSISPSANPADWEAAGRLLLPSGYCKQLLVFWDQTGMSAIHAVTKRGLYGYDDATEKFVETPLTHPPLPGSERGACVFQSVCFKPAGSMVYRYTGNVVQSAGPDKDDGLPPHLQGTVTRLVAGHGFLFAIIEANQETGDEWEDPMALGFTPFTSFFPATVSNGAILLSPGAAWHMLSQRTGTGGMGAAMVAAVDDTYRLWFSDGEGVYYVEQPTGLHNPLQNPNHRYAPSGFVETPWHDMKWAEVDKVALSLDVEAEASETETIDVYLAFDDSDQWEHIGSINQSGRTLFRIGGEGGRIFRSARMRIEMARGSDATKTPVLKSAVVGYLRVPDALDGWELILDLTEPRCSEEIGVPAGELITALYAAKRRKQAGSFVYRDTSMSDPETRRVWLHEIHGAEMTGEEDGGRYTVTLVELDT